MGCVVAKNISVLPCQGVVSFPVGSLLSPLQPVCELLHKGNLVPESVALGPLFPIYLQSHVLDLQLSKQQSRNVDMSVKPRTKACCCGLAICCASR